MSGACKIRPIKFKTINEDENESFEKGIHEPRRQCSTSFVVRSDEIKSKLPTNDLILNKNFSLEFSYPAVVFDQVCFSVYRDNQESSVILNYADRIKKSLGFSKGQNFQVDILKSINLNVPYGSIFGLLGPSSCGKTTLLRCLVGLLKPDTGSIRLFGHENWNSSVDTELDRIWSFFYSGNRTRRSPKCKVPGSNVGYMPQDLGLYEDFSIKQLLSMFGRYMKMESDLIAARINFMASFLDLPDVDRQILTLSGGQKRRVSFAIACLHMPPLIILDEPTVGVDPLLRQSIWKYLRRLADEENKTIIITTHYIEEAAQADQVALMRSGEILVQDAPTRIMKTTNCDSLEKAFLKICNGISVEQTKSLNVPTLKQSKLDPQPKLSWNNQFSNLRRVDQYKSRARRAFILIWALLYKNYRRNINSIPLLAFQFILPMIQMISFSFCVGGRPMDIGLGLVNYEMLSYDSESLVDRLNGQSSLVSSMLPWHSSSDNITTKFNNESLDTNLSEARLLSSRYISFIDISMIQIKSYDNLNEALADVRASKLWAVMEIGANFTETILKRFDLDNFYQLDLDTIQQSVIKLYPDRSNKVLDMICQRSLIGSYRKFILDQFEHFRKLPIELKEPIFAIKPNLISNSIDGYTESIAAGLLASLTYIMAAGLTTFIMVVERSAGILERTYTSGVNPVAYLLAHAVFRSFVMMIQIAAVMFLTFSILQQPLVGSIWLAYLMLITLNLTGISYGLFISSLVSNQNGAALTIVSSLVVKITLSGILWPFEAIPRWLRLICYVQPLTMPVQALKSITLKGAGLNDGSVQLGFLVSLGWLLVFLFVSARRFKFYQH